MHYLELPVRYTLPLRFDITAKIDAPAMYIMIGNGHASFGTHWSDNRRLDDICEPNLKINNLDSHIAMNEFNEISIIYGYKEMQILIGGEERYYSKYEKYMKSRLLAEMNIKGFAIKICCDKNTSLVIKSINVTEYIGMAKILHQPKVEEETADIIQTAISPAAQAEQTASARKAQAVQTAAASAAAATPNTETKQVPAQAAQPEKPSFDGCISDLPDDLKTAITDLDIWLKALRPLKFKRQLEKNGHKITYLASEYGFSYAIYPSYDVLYHTLQWYIVTNRKPEYWQRKANRMEDVLEYIARGDSDFARRMFANLEECIGGYGPGCLAKTPYKFEGVKKICCHGKMYFKMTVSDFNDVKRFIGALNEIITAEIEDNAKGIKMKSYVCSVCNYKYDPAEGEPDSGVAPGVPFEDLPDNWACPLCGVGKEMFEPLE
jgi:rubredoxin